MYSWASINRLLQFSFNNRLLQYYVSNLDTLTSFERQGQLFLSLIHFPPTFSPSHVTNLFQILLLEGGWVFTVVARNSNYELASVKSKKSLIYFWLWRVLRVCIVFYFGVVVTHLATNIGKYSIGRYV